MEGRHRGRRHSTTCSQKRIKGNRQGIGAVQAFVRKMVEARGTLVGVETSGLRRRGLPRERVGWARESKNPVKPVLLVIREPASRVREGLRPASPRPGGSRFYKAAQVQGEKENRTRQSPPCELWLLQKSMPGVWVSVFRVRKGLKPNSLRPDGPGGCASPFTKTVVAQ